MLSPCACGYAEIGRSLGAGKLPDDPFYRDWIRTCSSRDIGTTGSGSNSSRDLP